MNIQQCEMCIGDRKVGHWHPIFVIAEIGQAHEGSLGQAHAYIDAVAKAGVDAIKFQTHIAAAESSKADTFRAYNFPQDSGRYEYWKRMEFTPDQWAGLEVHAREKGLIFLSSPFSVEAVRLLERLGVLAWKIGSGDVENKTMIDEIIETSKPIILSTGMSTRQEISMIVNRLEERAATYALLQCTTRYPTKAQDLGLNFMAEMIKKYNAPIGFSDHSGEIYAGIGAAAMGASIVETHVTFSKECFGPDVSSSLSIEQLCSLVRGCKYLYEARSAKFDKDDSVRALDETKRLFGRSMFARTRLRSGDVLMEESIQFLKPGGGVAPSELSWAKGRVIKKNYEAGEQIRREDLE